jgi:hypothetical protein
MRFSEIDIEFQKMYNGLRIDDISAKDANENIRRNVVRKFLMSGMIHPKSMASILDNVNTSISKVKTFFKNLASQKEGINTFAEGFKIIRETKPEIPPLASFSDVIFEYLHKGLLKKSGYILKDTAGLIPGGKYLVEVVEFF